MGGFIGCLGKKISSQEELKKMGQTISHRGINNEQYYKDKNIALVVRENNQELKTILTNEENNLILTADANVYNYKELKDILIKKGHLFKTNHNNEVILHGYEEYGEKIVNLLEGPFSFVIWDKKKKELFGARDFLGIKPFYYYKKDNIFLWGSEIKGFLPCSHFQKEMNNEALKPYLTFQYSVLEETFFKNVYRLKPRHYFKYQKGNLKITNYYDCNYIEKDEGLIKLSQTIHKLINNSVKRCKKDDPKIGAFLSGGIDSSYITSLLKPSITYSVGFSYEGFDETNEAERLSERLGIKNKKQLITGDDFFKTMEKIQYHSDEPHANLSAVPLYFLSKLAHKNVKVVMSGEGADELYGGYDTYRESKLLSFYQMWPLKLRVNLKKWVARKPKFKGQNFLIKGATKIEDYYIGQAFIFNDDEANWILKKEYQSPLTFKDLTKPYFDKVKGKDKIVKKQYLDLNFWLPNDILLKADKMAMAHGLEVRMPFLDKTIFEHSLKIPSKYKVHNGITKYALRKASKKVIPKEWSKRKKIGFLVPFSVWLKEEKYYKIVKELFNEDFASKFFDKVKINEILDKHYKGVKNTARQVYTIYTFLVWYKVYFIKR